VTTPRRQKESPLQQPDALRNLISAQELLEQAVRRLAGVRRRALEEVDAAARPCGRDGAER
jgi:hypothetical protein